MGGKHPRDLPKRDLTNASLRSPRRPTLGIPNGGCQKTLPCSLAPKIADNCFWLQKQSPEATSEATGLASAPAGVKASSPATGNEADAGAAIDAMPLRQGRPSTRLKGTTVLKSIFKRIPRELDACLSASGGCSRVWSSTTCCKVGCLLYVFGTLRDA